WTGVQRIVKKNHGTDQIKERHGYLGDRIVSRRPQNVPVNDACPACHTSHNFGDTTGEKEWLHIHEKRNEHDNTKPQKHQEALCNGDQIRLKKKTCDIRE
ncbi:MAG: hypothetical protein V1915_02005, partial [Candidatus Bathyarchaeota archaeon]